MKQEEKKEHFRVTSTGTPAEDREEEEEKEKKKEKREHIYQVIWIQDNTSKIVYFPKNYRRDVFQVLLSGIASGFCPTTS